MNVSEDDLSVNADTNENSNERNFQELMNMDVIPKPVEKKLPMASIQIKCNPVAIKNSQLDSTSDKIPASFVDNKTVPISNSKNHVKFATLKVEEES